MSIYSHCSLPESFSMSTLETAAPKLATPEEASGSIVTSDMMRGMYL